MLDHGTGIVIGETAMVGYNCSILHHVTLGTLFLDHCYRNMCVIDRMLCPSSLPDDCLLASLSSWWVVVWWWIGHIGGSGKKGVTRHPHVGNGVLLGAGATVLGPVTIGDGSQVGAGTLVISDLPPHSVAVGVPARIIGSFIDVTEQPSIGMNQIVDEKSRRIIIFQSEGI
jgi:serine O-acetyltransferase